MDSRQQFENAWALAMSGDDGQPGNKPLRSYIDPERYRGDAVNFAWAWWSRSRESIAIDMPETEIIEAEHPFFYSSLIEAIHANGIRTK